MIFNEVFNIRVTLTRQKYKSAVYEKNELIL